MADSLVGGGNTRRALLAAGVITAGVITAGCASDETPEARRSGTASSAAASGRSSAECGPEQRARAPECSTLRDVARRHGTVNVVVTLTARFTPEGQLTGDQRRDQRRAIAAAQDALLEELAPHRPTVITRYTATPQLALIVNEAALHALLTSRRVSGIQQNTPQPPG